MPKQRRGGFEEDFKDRTVPESLGCHPKGSVASGLQSRLGDILQELAGSGVQQINKILVYQSVKSFKSKQQNFKINPDWHW